MVVPIVAPVLFWAAYHYYKDRHMPEPIGNLVGSKEHVPDSIRYPAQTLVIRNVGPHSFRVDRYDQ